MKTKNVITVPPHPSQWKRGPVQIYLTCNQTWVPETDATILNVEADRQGRDVLSFKWPHCDEVHNSLRRT